MSGRLLVAGFATRHIAGSARRAGYGVVAVDHFCDLDLARAADTCLRFETLEELAVVCGARRPRAPGRGVPRGLGRGDTRPARPPARHAARNGGEVPRQG